MRNSAAAVTVLFDAEMRVCTASERSSLARRTSSSFASPFAKRFVACERCCMHSHSFVRATSSRASFISRVKYDVDTSSNTLSLVSPSVASAATRSSTAAFISAS